MAQNTFLQSPFDALAPQTDTSIYTLPSLPGSEPVKPQEVPDVTRAAPAQAAQPVAEPEPVKAPPRRQAATSNLLPPAQYAPIFEAAAREFDVPVNVLMALGHQESRYNTAAIGQTTQWGRAKGMMQYLDSTASGLGINPFSAEESIPAAARQIRERLDKGYSMEDAVKEHFAGPNRKLWGEKTAAYGREVMEKVGKIGELLVSGATAPAATDPLADLNKNEPGRYRMATPEQVAEFEARQAAAAGKSDNWDKEAAAQQKAIDERGFFDRAGAAVSSGYDNMVQSLNTAKFVIGGGDSLELARALSDKFAEQQKAQRTTGQKEMDAAFKEVTDAKGVVDTTLKGAKAIYTAITNPKDLAVDAIEQLPNMLPTLGAGAAGAGGGAAVGAGAGALAAGVGAAPGAIAGAIWGGRTGMLAGTAATELGAEVEYLIGKQLEESRRAPTPENIKAILDSPGFIAAARDQGLKKGLTVAVIDQLFLGLGGKVAGKAGKAATVGGKAAYGAGAVALDATGEVVGEAASQKVARGEVDAGDALKEGVIGLGQSVVEPVVGAGMQSAKRAGQAMRPTAPAPRVEPTVPPVASAPVAPGSQAPSEPVATAAPSPSGPLTGTVEKAAGATEQPPRVSVVAPEGEVTGFMQSMREDGQGGFTARVLGDDGQVYTFTSADGVTITPLAPEPAGPLTAAVEKVAEQAPSTPAQAPSVSEVAPNIPAEGVALAPAVQDAQEAKGAEIKAAFDSLSGGGTTDDLYNKAFDALKAGKSTISGVKDPILSRAKAAFDAGLIGSPQDIRAFEQNGYPEVQPAPQAAPSLTDMTEPELRERLKYIASQGKANGWNKMLTNARREVEREINRRAEGATTDARPNAVAAGVRDEAAGGVQADAPAGVDQPAGRDGAAQLRDVGSADTGAPVPQDGASVPAASDAADGQPALTKKQSAALDRIAKGTAYFGSQEKAEAFIAKNDIGDTHEVVQTGKVRFDVKAKAPATAEESSTVQAADQSPDATKLIEAEAAPAIVPAGGTTTADEREPEQAESQAVRDFLDGKRPDAPTLEEVAAENKPAAEAATDVEQQSAIKRHGLPEGTTFSRGKGMASGKWIARAGDTQGNLSATIDEAASSLAQLLQLEKRREENTAAMVALSKKVADKLRRGEQPTDVELRDLFGLDPRHTYVKQSAVGQFLVDYMGVPRNKIRESLGKAAGTVTSDSGAKYPIVYPRKLHEVFGTTKAADDAQAGDKQAAAAPAQSATDSATTDAQTAAPSAETKSPSPNVEFIKALAKAREELPEGFDIRAERDSISLMENGRYAVNGLSRNAAGAEEAVRLAKQRAGQKPEVPTVSENKVFTEDAAAKARALLRSKLGQLNTGIDPEVMQAGITLAGYHIEKGARTFAAYAKAMIEDLGDVVKPYLKSWYMGVKYDPRAAGFDGMSDAAEVEGADVDALLKSAPSAPQPSGNLMDSFYQAISAGSMPSDNNALRKMVSDFDGAPADNARLKIAQEALEAAIARRARDIVAEGGDARQTYDKLVDLYQSQPNLNIRTSTSIENQAYSTPAPLAYVSAKLAGIDANTTVYEPTAGNGMLLITADPKNATANELEDTRFENLKAQGFDAIQGDALDVVSSGAVAAGSQDAVITNPPFGSVKDENGKATKVSVDGYKIGKIDHLIAAEALKAMKDGGKATLIIGADKAAGGVSTDDRIFFNWLYGNYNVTSHFEVDGKLYSRQGASWPVRVITVDGRRKSSNVSPRPGEVQRVGTWEEVYEQYQQGLDSQVADDRGAAVGADGAVQRDRADDAGTASQPAGAEARRDGAAKPRARKDGAGDVAGERAGAVRTGDAGAAERVAGAAGAQRGDGAPAVADRLADGAAEDRPAGGKARADRPARDAGADRVENQFQASYVPRSSRKDEGVLIPVNMAQPTQDALNALEDEVGDIDEYVMRELGYPSKKALHDALMGLQVDSVAMAIYQMSKGKGLIVSDATGIGKGRQAAALIRWAVRKDFVPVFVTVKPQLFTDMFNDLADIGTDDVAPLLMNADEWIANAAGEKLFTNKKSAHRKVIGDIAATGQLPEGRNALFLTYSQINTENIQRTALSALAPRAVFILDESHNAGGQSQTGEYVRGLLGEAAGVTYLSATYAKRPDNMPVYFKTDIGMAISDDGQLTGAMAAGGLPLQTVVSNNLVKAGQMFRRERSYDGVSIATIVATERRAEHEKLSDAVTEALRGIVDADRAFHNGFVDQMSKQLAAEGAALKDIAGNQASQSVNHTEFSSVVHNFVRQLLLGLKADAAADRAIEAIKAGEKPLIAVENTMGSFLAEYAAAGNIRPGQPLGNFDYRTVLSRALERSRVIVIKDPTGNDTKRRIELSELDPVTRDAYDRAQAVIDGLELDIPVSPIDWMRNRIQQAGYTVAEITGRNLTVDYSEGAPKLSQLPTDEQNDKVGTTRKFNDGRLDAIILNVSGSTGISLHASEKFKDQRPRRMIVAQAAQDINIFMQMLGRIHRTGQVKLPSYEILSVDLPAEKRPTSILSNKMKSLNANTSSNTESATSIKSSDLLNKYGDQVVGAYLADNTELALALGITDPVDSEGRAAEDLARKATGRLALMPVEVQKAFYAEVEEQYNNLIDYLNKTNQNELEPRTFDFDARETASQIIFEGDNPDSPFGSDAIYHEYSIKAQGKPMTPDEIRAEIAESLGGKDAKQHAADIVAGLDAQFGAFTGRLTTDTQIEAANAARRRAGEFIRDHRIGSGWRVEINGDVYNAVVTNIRSTHKGAGNPFSMSKIQVTVALNGALRNVTVPATQFEGIEVASLGGAPSVDALFESAPKDERQTAKIITGNLLAAYGEISTKGTIINFTKADGSTEQGILLPKAFNPAVNTRGDYRIRTAADALKFLRESEDANIARFGIANREGTVRVVPEGSGVALVVPKSKAKGGKFFLNKKITDITGDFVSQGQTMRVTVPASKAADAVAVVMDMNALYALPSMAAEAKKIIGEGDTRYSMGRGGSLTEPALRESLTTGVIGPVVSRLIDAGAVVLHQDVSTLPAGVKKMRGIQAATTPDGKIHIVADGVTAENARGVLLHESFHEGGEKLIGTQQWNALMKRLDALRRQSEQSTGRAREFFDKARARVESAERRGAVSPAFSAEEFGAYAIEEYENAPGAVRKWVDDFIGAVKAWLLKRFGKQLGQVTPAQLSAIAKMALMDAAAERMTGRPAMMSVRDVTDTPAFKRWFKGSKVVDGNGDPLVVYHGTKEDILRFDLSLAGTSTDSGGWGRGIYFAEDADYAAVYAGRAEGSNILPVYVALKNPMVVDVGARSKVIRDFGLEYPGGNPSPEWSQRFADAVKARGHDGVLVTMGGKPAEIVAFRPEQIKSAIGNNGTFDPANPDIRYSVSPEEADRLIDVADKALDAAPDRLPKDDYIGRVVGDLSLGAKLVVHPRTVAAVHPEFTPVYLTAISQIETRDATIAELGAGATEYNRLNQAGKENVNKVLELGRLMSQTYKADELTAGITNTGEKTVVSVGEDGKPRIAKVPVEALLSGAGEVIKLTPEEAKAYTDLRDMFDRALDKMRDQTLDELGFPELAGKKNAAADIAKMAKEEQGEKAERLKNIAVFVAEIEQAKRAGYVPFARYGDYVVTVKEKVADLTYVEDDAQHLIVQDVPASFAGDMLDLGAEETAEGWRIKKSQKASVERLTEKTVYSTKVETSIRDFFDERKAGKVDDIQPVREAIEKARAEYVGDNPNRRVVAFKAREKTPDAPVRLSDVDALAEVAQIDNATWDAVRDKLADAIKAKGFRRHFFHSDNVPGYTGDFERAIADYVIGMSGYLARRAHMKRWENSVTAIKDKPKLFQYASKYRDYVNSPQEEFAMIRQIGFFSYIAGVMASAFANLTQVPMLTVPTLAQVAPLPAVMKEVTRAYKDAMKMLGRPGKVGLDMFDPDKAPADVRDALKEAWSEGSFVPLETYDLMMTARQRNTGARKGVKLFNDATRVVSIAFTFAERLNRLVTFIAAARLAAKPAVQANAKSRLKGDALARREVLANWNQKSFAEWVVDESQYRMGKANRPTAMRGVGAALMQFKGYMIQTFEAWYRMSKLHGKQGKFAMAASLVTLYAFAGLWGLPGADDLRKLIEDIYKKITKKDLDLKTELRMWIAKTSGSNTLAQIVSKGASYPLGVDLTRVGMGSVVPDSPLAAAGIPFDMLIGRPSRAFDKASSGDAYGAAAEFTPNFMKHWIVAGGWAVDGVRDKYGSRILRPEDLSDADIGIKALGFQPSIVTDIRDYEYAQRRQETAVDALKRRYTSQLAKALAALETEDDPAEYAKLEQKVDEVYAEIDEHNESAPEEQQIVIGKRALDNRIQREAEGIKSTWGKERKNARGAAEDLRSVFGLSEDDEE